MHQKPMAEQTHERTQKANESAQLDLGCNAIKKQKKLTRREN